MAVTPVRFGLIGCGVNGTKQHAVILQDMPGAVLVAVCDESEEKARQLGELCGVPYYTRVEDLLAREDIEAVTVSVPSGLHAKIAIAAAHAGKHAIVEKPIEVTLERADRMIAAFRENGRKLSIISQHRFDDAAIQVKRDLDEGKFGKLVLGTAAVNWYRSQEYYDSGRWRGTWSLDGGGALMNQSIHTIDLLQWFFGPVDRVYAHCITAAHERIEVEDAAVATVSFRSGAIGTIVGTTCAYPGIGSRLEIVGANGTAVIERGKLVFRAFRDEAEPQGDRYAYSALSREKAEGGAGKEKEKPLTAHRRQVEDMIAAIRDDREPLVNGEEGRRPLEIILAVYESARTGLPVSLPPASGETETGAAPTGGTQR